MSHAVFVDTSVLVALVVGEPDWRDWSAVLDAAQRRYTSPLAILEAVMVISSIKRELPAKVEELVREVIDTAEIELLTIDDGTAAAAIEAFQRFGKGRHPARLNLGDCLSYACAKEHGLTLLYKGQDFARTDLA